MKVGINGIGVAGPALAFWLARYGHEPVLFERAPELRRGGYLIDFWGVGYELAERMNILPQLLDRCYRMQQMRMVDATGQAIAQMDIRAVRERVDGRFVSLARSDVSAALFGACKGVRVEFGRSITSFEQDTQCVTATLSDGTTETFDLVIGADGLHSAIRRLLFDAGGDQQRASEVPLGCHVAAFRISGYPRRDELTYVSHTEPQRQVARVTLRDDETLILLVCRSHLVRTAADDSGAKAALRTAFAGMRWEVPAILERLDAADDIYFGRVSQIHLPRWSRGRVGLLGDAAACASLLAGEGTGLAMLEAYVLAGEIDRAQGDGASALAAYHTKLADFIAAKQRAALRMRGFFVPQNRLGLWARNAAINVAGRPWLVGPLVGRALRDDFVLPEYRAV